MLDYMVREGQKVVPTCPECGCRLRSPWNNGFYIHYHGPHWLKDARGCKCEYAHMGAYIHNDGPFWWSTGPHYYPVGI